MAIGWTKVRRNRRLFLAWHGMAWHGMAWVMLAHGCAPATSDVDAEVAAILARARSGVGSDLTADVDVHDLGPILADGREVRHAFAIANPSGRVVTIVGAEAQTPCCSAVGSLPDAIAPGGAAGVPVVFRPGYQSGRKRVEFVVRTDDDARPIRRFALIAELVPEIEVRPHDENPATVPLNMPGRYVYTMTCRRLESSPSGVAEAGSEVSGRPAPESLTVPPPLTARFLGPAVERRLDGGIIETSRDFAVEAPPSPEAGARQAEVVLGWSDGRDWTHVLAWRVTPRIEVSPSGLVLRADDARPTRTVAVRCTDRPIHVTGVSGAILAGTPPEVPSRPAHALALTLTLDPARFEPPGPLDIVLATDHPDQPEVTLSVLVLPEEKGGD